MYFAEITFTPSAQSTKEEDTFVDSVEWFLALLAKNGQIYMPYVLGWRGEQLTACANVADSDALDERHLCDDLRKQAFDAVVSACSSHPEVVVFEREFGSVVRDWRCEHSLCVSVAREGPRCAVLGGASALPVPLFRLPISSLKRDEVFRWSGDYRAHYNVFLASGDLEIVAERQLSNVASGINSLGREYAEAIEKATGLPTYYHLWRYWGTAAELAAPESSQCPSCASDWLYRGDPEKTICDFMYCCEKCRLVSDPPYECFEADAPYMNANPP